MTRAVNCPGCNQQIGLADPPEVQENVMLRQQIEELQKESKMPPFIPNYQCKDGNCGQIHKSSRYSKLPKGKCSNCQQFALRNEGTCPWCKQNELEEIDAEELEDLGIRLPE